MGGRIMLSRIAVLLLLAWTTAGRAETPPASVPFSERLTQAHTALRVDGEGLHGPGSTVLADAVARAQYVMIGEYHLSREIPLFATGVCRIMAPSGLRAFVVETGPEVAAMVDSQLRRPDREERIAAFVRAHPHAIAFQDSRDESQMAARCAQMAGPDFALWGLDQEFLGSGGYLLERMLDAKPGPLSRAAIERLVAFDRTATAKALQSGSIVDLFLIQVSDQQLAEARAAIERDGGVRVKRLFRALTETRAIYLGQDVDGFSSNGRRARLMKQTLVDHLKATPGTGKLLFKFGDVHAAKGFNTLGQRDLGNFVAERADGEGTSSLHIAVYGAKGILPSYDEVGRPLKTAPFDLTDDPHYAWLKAAVPTGAQAATSGEWTVVDLRTLRANPPADMPDAWREAARQFDLLVLAPTLSPTTTLGLQ